jgi:hypothetical protein
MRMSGSKAETQRPVIVCIDQLGFVKAAICNSCPAGQSMTCCHVTPTVHHIIHTLDAQPASTVSPTTLLCKWTAPRRSAAPLSMDAVVPCKHILSRGDTTLKRRASSLDWDPRKLDERSALASSSKFEKLVCSMKRMQTIRNLKVSPLMIQFPSPYSGLPPDTLFRSPGKEDKVRVSEILMEEAAVRAELQVLLVERQSSVIP